MEAGSEKSKEPKVTLEQQVEEALGDAGAALATVQHSTALAPAGCEGTLDGFYPGDLIIPRMRIAQPQSKGVARGEVKPGVFASNLGTEKSSMLVCPLACQRGMVLWEKDGGDEPLCRSLDGMRPDPAIERPPSPRCHDLRANKLAPACPNAKWRAGGKPPACAMTFTYVMLDLDEMSPFILRFSKTSLQAARILLTRSWQLKTPLYGLQAKLGLSRVENERGVYYVPSFSAIGPLPDGLLAETKAAHAAFAAAASSAAPVDDAAAGGEGSDDVPF